MRGFTNIGRKKKDSKNREKQRHKVAKLHQKVANSRRDFHHKFSRNLVDENQVICLETLAVKNMQGNHCLAKSIGDAGWSQFVSFIEYKAEWAGKSVIRIGQFEPSSKLCNCGFRNTKLTLKDREWTCPKCGEVHDRDILAAKNILKFAFAPQNLVGQNCPTVGRESPEVTPVETLNKPATAKSGRRNRKNPSGGA